MYLLTKLAKNKLLLSVVGVIVFSLALAPATFATPGDDCNADADCDGGEVCSNGSCALAGGSGNYQEKYGLTGVQTGLGGALGEAELPVVIGSIIRVILSLLGVVAIVIVLIGGFKWMTAGGNDDQVAEARKWLMSGVIGLAIILSAWAITQFVFSSLNRALLDAGGGAVDAGLE